METVNSRLGARLRELRGDRSLYLVEKESGISRSLVRRYEAGTHVPEDRMLERLATFYGLPYQELKMLSFEDLYPTGSRERLLLKEWLEAQP